MPTFYITTPIYYPSGKLHLGHLYTTSLAWALRNYKASRGYETLFLTGADEHGEKIFEKAQAAQLEAQAYVDEQAKINQALWKKMDLDYDLYARTSNKEHWYVAKKAFSLAYQKGYIYRGFFQGWYSISDEEFITLSQAIKKEDGSLYHPQSLHRLVEIKEDTYFFKFSPFLKWLEKEFLKLEKIPNKKTLKELKNSFLKKGLEDLSVTRIKLKWGIPLNENSEHIIYVWFDALFSYLSALGLWQKNDHLYQKFWLQGDQRVHLVGKEITRFHCLYWPIFLKALGLNLPTKIISHGWIITNQGKMSKSKGNTLSPYALLDKYEPETLKWYLVTQLNLNQDNVFSELQLQKSYNNLLVNTFSNTIARTLALLKRHFNKRLVFNHKINLEETKQLREKLKTTFSNYCAEADNLRLDLAFKNFAILGEATNLYFDQTKPWLFKEANQNLAEILLSALEIIYAQSLILKVVMPQKIAFLAQAFGFSDFSYHHFMKREVFQEAIFPETFHLFERLK